MRTPMWALCNNECVNASCVVKPQRVQQLKRCVQSYNVTQVVRCKSSCNAICQDKEAGALGAEGVVLTLHLASIELSALLFGPTLHSRKEYVIFSTLSLQGTCQNCDCHSWFPFIAFQESCKNILPANPLNVMYRWSYNSSKNYQWYGSTIILRLSL